MRIPAPTQSTSRMTTSTWINGNARRSTIRQTAADRQGQSAVARRHQSAKVNSSDDIQIPGAQHRSAVVSRLLVRAGRSEGGPAPGATSVFIPSQVVSAKAYTQGLVWQIARPPDGLQQSAVRLLVARSGRSERSEYSRSVSSQRRSLREPVMADNASHAMLRSSDPVLPDR